MTELIRKSVAVISNLFSLGFFCLVLFALYPKICSLRFKIELLNLCYRLRVGFRLELSWHHHKLAQLHYLQEAEDVVVDP